MIKDIKNSSNHNVINVVHNILAKFSFQLNLLVGFLSFSTNNPNPTPQQKSRQIVPLIFFKVFSNLTNLKKLSNHNVTNGFSFQLNLLVGFLSFSTNNPNPTPPQKSRQIVAVPAFHQHSCFCCHGQCCFYALEHQIPQAGRVPCR